MYANQKQIRKAIEDARNILVKDLVGYTFELGKNPQGIFYNKKIAHQGTFGIVFPMLNGNKKIAFKIYFGKNEDFEYRLKEISQYLAQYKFPFFVDYSYLPSTVKVPAQILNNTGDDECEDCLLNSLIMEWVEGKTLKDYLEEVIASGRDANGKKCLLKELADKFLSMFQLMHKAHISHGDLQHGNIIIVGVQGHPEIKLVDYDSIYVPSLYGYKQITEGLPGYQHPQRTHGSSGNNIYLCTERDDFFSEKIIYSSILILSEHPELWQDPKAIIDKNNDGLLFFPSDLSNLSEFEQSYIYQYAKMKCSSEVMDILDEIKSDLSKDLIKIEPLSVIASLSKGGYVNQDNSKYNRKTQETVTPDVIDRLKSRSRKYYQQSDSRSNFVPEVQDPEKYRRR